MPGAVYTCVTDGDSEELVSGVPSPNCHLYRTLTPPLAVAVNVASLPASRDSCGGIGSTDSGPVPVTAQSNIALSISWASVTVIVACPTPGAVGVPLISPVLISIERPAGNALAPYVNVSSSLSLAVICKLTGSPAIQL